ncbi:MAG TPA: restriction endonuclease, partial [Fimbriiglobus sp.]|nr:restriction endonuclease [Fimbriiglobus sp.]
MEQKPTPSQFGLTEEAVARLAAIDSGDDSAERWAIRFIAFSPATLGLYAAGCPKGLLVFLGVIGFFVWIWAEEHLLKLLFPKLDAYRAYRDACAAHERRRAEQEHQLELKRLAYWSDLPYAQLENEVAALFRRMGHRAQVQGGSGDGGVDVAVD